jgi:hypothetical protein
MPKSILHHFNLDNYHELRENPDQKVRNMAGQIQSALEHSGNTDDLAAAIELEIGYWWRQAGKPVPFEEYAPHWLYANGSFWIQRGIRKLKKKYPAIGKPMIEFNCYQWGSVGEKEFSHLRSRMFEINGWKRAPKYR